MVNQHHIGKVFYTLFSENDNLLYNSGMCDENEIFKQNILSIKNFVQFLFRDTVQLLFDNRWTEYYAKLNIVIGNSKLKVAERTERDWLYNIPSNNL